MIYPHLTDVCRQESWQQREHIFPGEKIIPHPLKIIICSLFFFASLNFSPCPFSSYSEGADLKIIYPYLTDVYRQESWQQREHIFSGGKIIPHPLKIIICSPFFLCLS